jgi:hypothetical protein
MEKLTVKLSSLKLNAFVTLLVLLSLSFNSVFAQKSPWISAEVKINSIFYSTNLPDYTFSPGASILIAENFGRNKISFGFEYTIFNLNYNYPSDSSNHLINREFNTEYLNFPLLYAYKFHVSNKVDISIFGGISFSIPHNKSTVISYYNNSEPIEEDLIKRNTSTNRLNLKTGANLYYHLNKRIDIYFNLYSDLNIINKDDYPRYINAPSSSALGLGIGIEYNWKPLKK